MYSLVVPDNKVRSIITSLLIKQDLCNQPNLQEYWKTENKATGKVFKDSQSFLELRYLAQWRRNSWENLFKDQSIFLLGDHFINSHNVFLWWCIDIVRGKLRLVTLGTWRVKRPAASLGEGTSGRLIKVLFTVIYWQLWSYGI